MYLSRFEENALLPSRAGKEALALIGPRRAGKTTLSRRLLEVWLSRGGKGAYIDLESPDAPASLKSLLLEIEKVPLGGMLALDEVQVVEGWHKAVRSQIETGKRHVIVSG